MYTYQDLEAYQRKGKLTDFVRLVVSQHKTSPMYKEAKTADLYDKERNPTIMEFTRTLFDALGCKQVDETASNLRLTSNFFARLNTQRCSYSLGNGITFQVDGVADKLGDNADKNIKDAGYYALIHGVSYLYWVNDHIHVFTVPEFAPLWDELSGNLGAGIRFWQIESDTPKPLYATLYMQDGYIDYQSDNGSVAGLEPVVANPQPYRETIRRVEATGEEVRTAHNYSALPIVPMWGSRLHQSTLVGMRSKIDAYDIVQSGFANDMQDCAQIYWLINNAGGMNERDLSAFRERLLYRHIANVNTADGVTITPYTQEIPYNARNALLDRLKAQIYQDFGYMDPTSISAGNKTATEINAAYQALDENADDFEYQIIEAVQKVLGLLGVNERDATPQFKRNRISNETEQVEMVLMEAPYLDEETLLRKLPNISSEEVDEILKRKSAEELSRVEDEPEVEQNGDVNN